MMFDLNGFQRDLLYVLASMDEPSGREIKARVESELDTTITNGRLYPNLDELVERSYVDKGAIDRRTNYYAVTGAGLELLHDRQEWVRTMLARAKAEEAEGTGRRGDVTGRTTSPGERSIASFPFESGGHDSHDVG